MLPKLRYYFEIISVPIFAFLAFHLSVESIHNFYFFATKNQWMIRIVGIIILIIFIYIWHRPALKKWVPCAHVHCHNEQTISHFLAIIALCLHFFPEAVIRHNLLSTFRINNGIDYLFLLGFASHFIVDIIVMIFISFYWNTFFQKILSMIGIIAIWIIAFLLSGHTENYSYLFNNRWILLLSSFLLAMFIHKPHKPILHCDNCE